MKGIKNIIGLLVLVFGIQAAPIFGAEFPVPSMGWAGPADAPPPQQHSEQEAGSASAPGPLHPQKVPEEASMPEKKETPFKEFVPSERIEPDQAVDFPADI